MCISNKRSQVHVASSSKPSQVANQDPTSIAIPTFREERSRSLDLSSLSSSALAKLKDEDPFMYYGIPTVTLTELSGNAVDAASLAGQADTSVSRQARVSVECHPDLLLQDLTDDTVSMEQIVNEARGVNQQQVDIEEEMDDDTDDLIQAYMSLLSEDF